MDASRENLGELQQVLQEMDGRGQTMLLPALLRAQEQFGYVPEDAAAAIGESLKVPLAEIYGVLEFYDLITARPTARTVIRFCNSVICAQAGGGGEMASLCKTLDLRPREPGNDGEFQVSEIPCLGLCDHAPAILAGNRLIGDAHAQDYQSWLAPGGSAGYKLSGDSRWLTERVGVALDG